MILRLFYVLTTAWLFGRVIISGAIDDLGMFIILGLVPFFITFPNIYFLCFILFRSAFDAIEKYHLPLPNPNMPVAAFLIFLYWIILICDKRNLKIILNNRFLMKFNFFFALFLTALFVSIIFSGSATFNSFSDVARLLSILLIVNYAVVYVEHFPHKEAGLLNIILFSSIIPVSLGIYQLITKRGMIMEGANRIYGSFIHPNVFAEYLVIVVFLVILLSFPPRVKFINLFLKSYLFAVLLLILNTFTRNVWLALLLTIGIYITFGKNLFEKLKIIFWALMCIAMLIPFMYQRFMDLVNPVSGSESSLEWRLNLWKRTFVTVFESPWIGHGLGTFQEKTSVMAHNDYLRLAFETGFIGLFFYLILMGMIILTAFKKAKNKNFEAYERKKGLIVFCIFMTMMIISTADNLARSTVILTYIFVLAGIFLYRTEPFNKPGPLINYANITD